MKPKTILDAIYLNDFEQFKTLLPNASVKQRRDALIEAATRGKNQYISLFLPVKSHVKREALLEAVRMGHLSSVSLLLPQHLNDSEALCCAIRSNKKDVFDFLLRLTPLTSHNFMALRACLMEGSQHFALFETLLEEASILYPEQLKNDFHYVLSQAVLKKDTKAFEMLLQHKMFSEVKPIDMLSAVKNCDSNFVERLLPYATQDSCSSSLLVATRNHDIGIVKLLLKKADPTWNNSEALQYACVSKQKQFFELLYPLSDPHAALYELQKKYTETYWGVLENRIQHDLRKKLHNKTAQEFRTSSASRRKM